MPSAWTVLCVIQSSVENPPPFGIMLVASDPPLSRGGSGDAHGLTMHRLERRQWPIYERTRNRNAFVTGVRLCVYIAGNGPTGGLIVATATTRRVRPWRSGTPIDPPIYATEVPYLVLELEDASPLPVPVRFRDVLPGLSCAPADLSRWGPLLQGGSRRFSQADWELMFAPRPDIASQ